MQIRAQNDYFFGASTKLDVISEENGDIALAWLPPDDPASVTGYQFRLRTPQETLWRPWRDFTISQLDTSNSPDDTLFSDLSDWVEIDSRIFTVSDLSAQIRIHMTVTALRYSLDYPLGTGVYVPNDSHISDGTDMTLKHWLLSEQPHNQFMYMLVLFGFPGLILLILFYALIFRSLIHSARFVKTSSDRTFFFPSLAIVGALAASTIVTLFHTRGPFLMGWSHFFIIGLVFCIERIVAARESPR